MTSLLCHLHFWTLKTLSPGTASGSDTGVHVYHEKTAASLESGLNASRKEWAQARGIVWVPRNKKPEKLRETLRECEEVLSTHQPIGVKWKSLRHLLVFLDNGTFITYTVAKHSGDVERIFLDRSLISRIGVKIDNVLMVGSSMILTTAMNKHLVHISFTRKKVSSSSSHNPLTLTHSDSGRKLDKLSAQDLKISYVEMAELPANQVQRHLISNCKDDLVVLWWADTQEGGWSWSSMAQGYKDNLLVFAFKGGKLQYCNGLQTDYDPISMVFSKTRGHILYSLEKTGSSEYTPCTYEYADRKISKVSIDVTIKSNSNILVCERNKNEALMLLGCEDGSLILYDSVSSHGQVKKTKAYFSTVSIIKWHPAGALVFACSRRGEIQCFDIALNPILFQVFSEEPSSSAVLQMGRYFVAPAHLKDAGWGSELENGDGHGSCYDNFVMVFGNGPIVLLRIELGILSKGNLGPVELVSECTRLNNVNQALSILERLSWNYQQNDCFSCMTIIINHLLTQPLSSKTETQINSCLATYLHPDTQTISSLILHRYNPHIIHLQRRFFHLLTRYGRLEKAYEIAISLQAKDLFMVSCTETVSVVLKDIHFLALDLNEPEIAEKSRQKAESAESANMSMPWLEGAVTHALSQQQGGLPTGSDEDMNRALQVFSTLSFESLASSVSDGPLAEEAVQLHSDHSATPSHSEVEELSDNEGTQE